MTPVKKRILKIISAIFTFFAILFVTVTYSGYLDLKKTFIEKISHKATVLVGQGVAIGDFSFGPSGEINLHDIIVNNPRGFEPGHLLTIKRLSLDLRWQELVKGILSFRSIGIRSPELTLMAGEKGIMNVSDELKRFLSKKGTTQYLVDEFRIRSGAVSLNGDILTAAGDIDLSVKNLSSREYARTLVGGTLLYAGNPVKVDGWAYLNSAAKNFNVSLSADDFSLSALREIVKKYRVDAGKLRAALVVGIQGDTVKGCTVSSQMRLKGKGFFPPYRDTGDVRLEGHAFYDIPKSSLAVKDLSLHEGNVSLMNLKGTVADFGKRFSYAAEVKIGKIDFSHFNFMKGAQISGEVRSDTVRIKGDSGKLLSEASGVIRLRDGGVKSQELHMEKVDADITFSAGAGISFEALLSAKLLSFGVYRADIPIDASLSLRGRGNPEKVAVTSAVHLSRVSLKLQDGKDIVLGSSDFSAEGTVSRTLFFAGSCLVRVNDLAYRSYKADHFTGSFGIDYRKSVVTLRDLKIDSEAMETSAGRISMQTDEKKSAYSVEIRNMSVHLPAKKVGISNTDLDLTLRKVKKNLSGEATVSSGEIAFQGVPARITAGTLRFDENDFSLSIPAAGVAGGKATLLVRGKVSKEPFPLKVDFSAEGVDLGVLSRASEFDKITYGISGNVQHAVFSGVVDSAVSLQGNVALEAGKISLTKKDSKTTVLKDLGVSGQAACKGRDCGFTADMVAGGMHVTASGEITRVAEKERVLTLNAQLAETKLTDMRATLWNIFPDGLLYSGLDGHLSSDVAMEYSLSGIKATGKIRLTDVLLEGENAEYAVGPVNGTVPFQYDPAKHVQKVTGLPSFEPSEFAALSRYYAQEPAGEGEKITIGTVRYGFRILDTFDIWVTQAENGLNIRRLGANMFGGRLDGSALVDFSGGLTYRAGILLKGLSLAKLCEEIEPIKGYISGKVDGIASVKGSGAGLSRLIGKADFWSYSSGGEKTKISKEFLQKMGGASLKTYLGDRSFDKGVMSLYLQNGYVIFRELEISHGNILGVRDLSVKVAPYNNRIEIDHLLWAMTEAAHRAGEKK
jgi:hypothetical protein